MGDALQSVAELRVALDDVGAGLGTPVLGTEVERETADDEDDGDLAANCDGGGSQRSAPAPDASKGLRCLLRILLSANGTYRLPSGRECTWGSRPGGKRASCVGGSERKVRQQEVAPVEGRVRRTQRCRRCRPCRCRQPTRGRASSARGRWSPGTRGQRGCARGRGSGRSATASEGTLRALCRVHAEVRRTRWTGRPRW